MRILSASIFAIALSGAAAYAQAPSPEDAMARCVAEIEAASAAQGQDPAHAPKICECLVPKLGENAALVDEIEGNGGLPSPEDASPALNAVITSCLPTE